MQSVSGEQVDELIAQLIRVVVEHQLQERCTGIEASRVRLALQHPSAETSELVSEAHGLVVEALELGVIPLLNHSLGFD